MMDEFDRSTPAGTVSYFRHSIKTGDIAGAMRCFDSKGVYINRAGEEIRGVQQIELAMRQLCAWRPDITGGKAHVTILDDLAIWLDTWEMKGTLPDGAPITMHGHTTCLLKRNTEGIWLWLVDNPFGAAVLEVESLM
jgi:ketosteroid isomerase-like protein